MSLSTFANLMTRLAAAGSTGRRPRGQEGEVVGFSQGGVDVKLGGVVCPGLRNSSGITLTDGQRVRVHAIQWDHAVVGVWDD